MSKGAKIFIYILLAAIAGLIIYIIATGKNQGGDPKNDKKVDPNTPDPLGTGTGDKVADAADAGIDTTKQGVEVNKATIPLNTQVYAAEDLVNVYRACAPSQKNLYGTYNKGELIGTFIAKEGNCTKVAIDTYYNAKFIGSWKTGSDDAYIPFNAKVYFK